MAIKMMAMEMSVIMMMAMKMMAMKMMGMKMIAMKMMAMKVTGMEMIGMAEYNWRGSESARATFQCSFHLCLPLSPQCISTCIFCTGICTCIMYLYFVKPFNVAFISVSLLQGVPKKMVHSDTFTPRTG